MINKGGEVEIVFFWLLFAGLVGLFASSRGRSGFGWFLFSAVLSPLIGFIIVLVIQDLKAAAAAQEERKREEERREIDRKREHEKQLESLKALRTPQEPIAPVGTVADQIEKLGQLRDKGLLTEEEFKAQKSAVLARA